MLERIQKANDIKNLKREACRTEPGCDSPFAGSAWRRWRICLLEAR